MPQGRFSQKTLDCLRLCAIDYTEERRGYYDDLCRKYSEKAVNKKLEDLANRGYIEYGVHPRGAWLTPRGRGALENATYDQPTGT